MQASPRSHFCDHRLLTLPWGAHFPQGGVWILLCPPTWWWGGGDQEQSRVGEEVCLGEIWVKTSTVKPEAVQRGETLRHESREVQSTPGVRLRGCEWRGRDELRAMALYQGQAWMSPRGLWDQPVFSGPQETPAMGLLNGFRLLSLNSNPSHFPLSRTAGEGATRGEGSGEG